MSQLPDRLASILSLDGSGTRPILLIAGKCRSSKAASEIRAVSSLYDPAIVAGLWVYFSAFEEAHSIAQDLGTKEGSYWHAIVHRMEPDDWNSAYWFRRVGQHPIYPELASAAQHLATQFPKAEFRSGGEWDPFHFIEFCAEARDEAGSQRESLAKAIQLVEWQLLFTWCLPR